MGLVGASALAMSCSTPTPAPEPDLVGEATAAITQCGLPAPVPAQCQEVICTPDGLWQTQGVTLPHSCDSFLGPNTGQCDSNWECQAPVPTGYLTPHYYVLTVVYAPPGKAGTGTKSSVTYGATSSTGTEVKTTSAFKSGITVAAQATLQWGPASVDMSASNEYSKSQSDATSLKLTKTQTTTIGPAEGSATDAIDHDFDAIYLWLNPRVYLNGTLDNGLQWTVFPSDNLSGSMDIQYVYVSWLKNPATMPPAMMATLTSYGITTAEFPEILKADPVANGEAPTPDRFTLTATTVPYEPPLAAGGNSIPYTVAVTNDRASTQTHETTTVDTVKLSATVGTSSFISFAKAQLTVSTELDWTKTNAHSATETNTQSASVTITGPSFGYTGPTDLQAYYDTIYGTFLLAPITRTPIVSGIVRNVLAQPIAGQPITLMANNVPYKTVTRSNGEYRFFDVPAGPAQVTMNTTSWSIPIQATPTTQDLTIPTAGCQISIGAPVTGVYGQPIHLTSSAQCDTGPADVQWYHRVNSSFAIVRPYGAAASFDYVADSVGPNQFYATVRTHGTTAVQATSSTATVTVADNTPTCTNVTVTAPTNNQLLKVGASATLTGHASCPAGVVPEYQYWVKRATDANWQILPGYTTGSGHWTPPATGAWLVEAVARSTGSHVNYQVRSSGTPVTVAP